MKSYRCTIMRGGTSKGVFIMEDQLPTTQPQRDAAICAIFGSPDVRQIDGLGGADVLTSKLAIIAPSTRPNADVDYTFGQVSIDTPFVDYKGNCGNISSAVGPFAIDEGLVAAKEPFTTVRIHLTNTHAILKAEVPVKDGRALVKGDFAIDGVPGTGARITLDWAEVAGGMGAALLPSGRVTDVVRVDGRAYEVTLVETGNPLVFITAETLGMSGGESVAEIEGNEERMRLVEAIRGEAAVRFGLVTSADKALAHSPYAPFFAIVSPPRSYTALDGRPISSGEMDLRVHLVFMQKMHKAYPITGAVCTGVASRLPGSVVERLLDDAAKKRPVLRIGHPSGVLPVEIEAEPTEGGLHISRLGVYRTARRIMDGTVYTQE